MVNNILGSCDLKAKEKDVMVGRGKKSQAVYVFFISKAENR